MAVKIEDGDDGNPGTDDFPYTGKHITLRIHVVVCHHGPMKREKYPVGSCAPERFKDEIAQCFVTGSRDHPPG